MGHGRDEVLTRREGWCWFFGAINHCVEDIVGLARGEGAAIGGRRWSGFAKACSAPTGPTRRRSRSG